MSQLPTIPEEEFEFGKEEPRDDPCQTAEARERILKRCEVAHIEAEDREDIEGPHFLLVSMPNGRSKRDIPLSSLKDFKLFDSVPFETYVVLGGYHAVCSYEGHYIEAAFRPLGRMPVDFALRRLFRLEGIGKRSNGEAYALKLDDQQDSGLTITLAPASRVLSVLSGSPFAVREGRTPAITITNTVVSQHDIALNLLERISNALFFQIDLSHGISFGLSRHREPRLSPRSTTERKEQTHIEFPKNEYDHSPIELYWYAHSALGMPLLQYLAYYQAIEYYFPTYSQADARRKVRNILKDPSFRPTRDADIGRILSSLEQGTGYGFGDERSQLRATIQECVDPGQLRSFFEDRQRSEFFSSKAKGLTDRKLPLANPDADLRNDVADRIYEIRCKIVHTKLADKGGQVELLLPFSPAADRLYFDIDLVQFVARQVLISASTPLRL